MSITVGSASAPQQLITNFDALFTQSLANNRKNMIDAIGATNAIFYDLIKGNMYKSKAGGTILPVPLMYALSQGDWYDGYDELSAVPTDGVTEAIYQWAQCAVPIMYSMKELKQNKQKLIDLVDTKMTQLEMGIQEFMSTALLQGTVNTAGSLATAQTSTVNGATGIDPIAKMIHATPSSSLTVGGLDQATYTWWRNKSKTAAATTYLGYINEVQNIFNTTSLGTGGPPKLIYTDQVSYELFQSAFFNQYRQTNTDMNYPFDNIVFKGARMVYDDKVCDAYSDVANASTYGTMYFINPKFLEMNYEEDSDFEMLKDENGKVFQKPTNGDSRLGHMAWMGQTCVTNRRKQGVYIKIPRTLTVS